MRRIKSRFILYVLIAAFLASTSSVLAVQQKTATLFYPGISILLNGTQIVPTDADGKMVEPFIMENTTYLPLRGISSCLGLAVSWDPATWTVDLTTEGSGPSNADPSWSSLTTKEATLFYRDITIRLDGNVITPVDATGNTVEPFIVNDSTYLPLRGIASALGLGVDWDQSTHTVRLTSQGSSSSDNLLQDHLDFTKAWSTVEPAIDGGGSYITTYGFFSDGTVYCSVGKVRSDLYNVYKGTYQVSGNQVFFTIPAEDGIIKKYTYLAACSESGVTFTQLTQEGLFYFHKAGDTFRLVPNEEFSAADCVELYEKWG